MLAAGMVLMFVGFFSYLDGKSSSTSVLIVLIGATCEILGFWLAYRAYKSARGAP